MPACPHCQIPPPLDPGAVKIDLRALGASATGGILLATPAENKDHFALTQPNEDGSFTVFTVGNDIPDTVSRALTAISFVYVPVGDAGKGKSNIIALGRVCSDASTTVAGGEFSIGKAATGVWHLRVTGYGAVQGTLLLTPISTPGGNNRNNMISYS